MNSNYSFLRKGNSAFAAGDYEFSVECYIKAARDVPILANSLRLNVELALKQLGLYVENGRNDIFSAKSMFAVHRKLGEGLVFFNSTPKRPEFLSEFEFQKIMEHKLFDVEFYIDIYGNNFKCWEDPLEHYLLRGIEKGFNPSERFDTNFYLKNNEDVASAGVNPFVHYACGGMEEGRVARQLAFGPFYNISDPIQVKRLPGSAGPVEKVVKPICFYLPQYHAIPENDRWWGKGFTEWTNVVPAKPQFEGHYQPHVPHSDIGYYNLLDVEAQKKQIELAKLYGIGGFCYYLYWFSGKRLLEKPIDNMLSNPELDFPFCVCWANENWSRRWDGRDQDLLMVQEYSDEDDIDFIENVSKYLRDSRYIRIDEKPVLLIYRPNLFPDMRATARRWRRWCLDNGVGEIYLAYPQSFEVEDPRVYGFDAALEFPPNNSSPPDITKQVKPVVDDFKSKVYDWRIFLERSFSYEKPNYQFFRSVTPAWDNTARKKNKGIIFHNSSPELFQINVVNAMFETVRCNTDFDKRLMFVNAWNEWAEGAHLEPDERYGYAWLSSVRNAHSLVGRMTASNVACVIHAYYIDVFEEMLERLSWSKGLFARLYVSVTSEDQERAELLLQESGHNYRLFIVDNHGRDVYPFIKILPELKKDKIDFLAKIHTKKSLHRVDGDKWRNELYDQLLSKRMYLHALRRFCECNTVGFIAPDNSVVPLTYYWGSNEKNVYSLCSKSSINIRNIEDERFIAGTMFYARLSAFDDVNQLNLAKSDFDPEEGQTDGTLAHALERFFGVCGSARGYYMEEPGFLPKKSFEYAKVG